MELLGTFFTLRFCKVYFDLANDFKTEEKQVNPGEEGVQEEVCNELVIYTTPADKELVWISRSGPALNQQSWRNQDWHGLPQWSVLRSLSLELLYQILVTYWLRWSHMCHWARKEGRNTLVPFSPSFYSLWSIFKMTILGYIFFSLWRNFQRRKGIFF